MLWAAFRLVDHVHRSAITFFPLKSSLIFLPLKVLFDKARQRRYKVFMKTLTITDAKKNLGRWLAAAARGEDIGIVCGADIVALRKVNVEATDYVQREYGVTPEQAAALQKATERRYRSLKRSKKLVSVTAKQLRDMLE